MDRRPIWGAAFNKLSTPWGVKREGAKTCSAMGSDRAGGLRASNPSESGALVAVHSLKSRWRRCDGQKTPHESHEAYADRAILLTSMTSSPAHHK